MAEFAAATSVAVAAAAIVYFRASLNHCVLKASP